MSQYLFEVAEEMFKGKALLTLDDVLQFLGCDAQVVYNWIKRTDPKRRPPRLSVGKELRFPKKDFITWLIEEQGH